MQNSQANTKKIFTKFFWGAGKVSNRFEENSKLMIVKVVESISTFGCFAGSFPKSTFDDALCIVSIPVCVCPEVITFYYSFKLSAKYCGKRPPEQSELWEGKPSKPYLLRAFQPYSGCTKSFPKVLSAKRFQATKAMRAKRAGTVPLQPYFGLHWLKNNQEVIQTQCLQNGGFYEIV